MKAVNDLRCRVGSSGRTSQALAGALSADALTTITFFSTSIPFPLPDLHSLPTMLSLPVLRTLNTLIALPYLYIHAILVVSRPFSPSRSTSRAGRAISDARMSPSQIVLATTPKHYDVRAPEVVDMAGWGWWGW